MTRISLAKSIGWFFVTVLTLLSFLGFFALLGSDLPVETEKKMIIVYAISLGIAGMITLFLTKEYK